jgi:hypothetical protein
LQSTHQMTPREYKSIHPGYLICKSSVTCELCEWSILHDEEKLRRHFELYHPLVTLGEYYSNYVASRHSQLVDGDSGNEPDNEDEDKNDAEIEMVVSGTTIKHSGPLRVRFIVQFNVRFRVRFAFNVVGVSILHATLIKAACQATFQEKKVKNKIA